MSNARVIEEIKVNPQALGIVKQQLKATINKLNHVLEKAFSGGYEKPEGRFAVRLALYKNIWTGLSLKADLNSLDDFDILTKGYDIIHDTIDECIEQFCIEEKAVKDDIAPKYIVDLLKSLVLLRKAIFKQEYYLSRFTENDEVSQVIDDVNTLRRQGDIIMQRNGLIPAKEIQQEIVMRDQIIQLFNEYIKQSGLGLKDIELIVQQLENPIELDGFTRELKRFLAPLPTTEALNNLIRDIRQAGNSSQVETLRQQLDTCLTNIGEAYEYLRGLPLRLNNHNKPARIYIKRCATLAEDLNEFQECLKVVSDPYLKIQPVTGVLDANNRMREKGYREIVEACAAVVMSCNTQGTLFSESYTWGIFANVWNAAATIIHQSIEELNKDFENFLKPYLQIADQVHATKKEINPYLEQSKMLGDLSSQLAAKIQIVSELIGLTENDLSEDILSLNRQLESHTAFVGSFFSRNWGKMLSGLLAGGAGSAVLILSLENADVLTSDETSPAGLAVVSTFVTLFGFLAGCTVGAVKEMCCHPPTDNLPANREERRPLLKSDQVIVDMPDDIKDEEFDKIKNKLFIPLLKYVDSTQPPLPKEYHNNGIFSSVQNLLPSSDPNQPLVRGYGGPSLI